MIRSRRWISLTCAIRRGMTVSSQIHPAIVLPLFSGDRRQSTMEQGVAKGRPTPQIPGVKNVAPARRVRRPDLSDAQLPQVLVQLPVCDEGRLAVRVAAAAAQLDWPQGK